MFTLGYRAYRFIKKTLAIQVLENGRLVNLFNRRHAINGAILILTFLVTATNIQASNGPVRDEVGSQKSILAQFTNEIDDELLVEEADTVVEPNDNVSYIDGQALNAQEYYTGTNSGASPDTDEISADDPAAEETLPFYAVRSQSESASQLEHPPTRSGIIEYVVQEGDNVESIAEKYGLQAQTVIQANGLGSRGLIRIGQTLRLLPIDGIVYKTKKGDNLSKIATTYRSDTEKIAEMNSLAADAVLDAGVELVLPGGRLPAPPSAPRPSSYASNFRDTYVPPTAFDGLSAGALLWPCASRRITQYFTRRHFGLDVGAAKGTPIYAADDGTVIYSGWNSGGYGNMTILDHGGGLYTRYGHATKLLTRVGDVVKKGDTIALVGSTGRSTGPHLHFEVLKGDIHHRINPLDWIK